MSDVGRLYQKISQYVREGKEFKITELYDWLEFKINQYTHSELYNGDKIAKLLYKHGFHTELLICMKTFPLLFAYFYSDGDIDNVLDYYQRTYINLVTPNLNINFRSHIMDKSEIMTHEVDIVNKLNLYANMDILKLYTIIYKNVTVEIKAKFPTPEELKG